MKIPADTIARLSHLLPDEPTNDPMDCFRLDNGLVMTTNKAFMAIDHVAEFEGVFYIRADRALIEQCRIEAQWSSVIEFTPVPAINYTTAMSSMGWKTGDNLGVWPTAPSEWDSWRERILDRCLLPLETPNGHAVFDAEQLELLARCSPSGRISMEKCADPVQRPMVVRDIDSPDWIGFFSARISDGRHHYPAGVPGWLR